MKVRRRVACRDSAKAAVPTKCPLEAHPTAADDQERSGTAAEEQ